MLSCVRLHQLYPKGNGGGGKRWRGPSFLFCVKSKNNTKQGRQRRWKEARRIQGGRDLITGRAQYEALRVSSDFGGRSFVPRTTLFMNWSSEKVLTRHWSTRSLMMFNRFWYAPVEICRFRSVREALMAVVRTVAPKHRFDTTIL